MANNQTPGDIEKKKIKEDRKRLKADEKKQKQEIKKRAKELSKREAQIEDEEDKGGVPSFLITTVIVIVWLAIICLFIKMDVGHFGSEFLAPVIKDIPVINKILPSSVNEPEQVDPDGSYGGYSSLKEAVDYIHVLELELEHEQTVNNNNSDELTRLYAEIARLQEFENMNVEFERIENQFYQEVVYSDKGPGLEAYQKYYESMNPTIAESLYKQVIEQLEEDKEFTDYVAGISAMKPAQAASALQELKNDLKLVARILEAMDTDTRGKIMGAMDASFCAQVIKIMDPEG